MRTALLTKFILIIILFGFYGCGEKIASSWEKTTIIVDGNGNEWQNYPLQYNEDFNLVYGVVNNDSMLYCMIRFNDERIARQMNIRGFTLWVNNSDENTKLVGIHYQDEHLLENLANRFRAGDIKNSSREYPSGVFEPKGIFTLAHNDSMTDTPINDIYGMNASASLKNGYYCYEYSLALLPTINVPSALHISAGQEIAVCLELNAMNEEDKERIMGGMERHKEAMSGRDESELPEGMHRRGHSNRPSMPDTEAKEFWISVKLASPPVK
jgi:hypothetical protein